MLIPQACDHLFKTSCMWRTARQKLIQDRTDRVNVATRRHSFLPQAFSGGICKEGKYDVVFAEWNTKFGQGEELTKAIRKVSGKLPIIVTAPQSKNIDELKQAYPNATDYLTTPFTTEELRLLVGEYVPSIAG